LRHLDIVVFGHVSKDINIAPGSEERSVGGAVVYSSVALRHLGAQVLAVTKLNPADVSVLEVFAAHGVPAVHRPSANTTSIRNTYHSADRERRTCEALSQADAFETADVPEDASTDLYYLGGLIRGEFPEDFVAAVTERGKTALDVQGFLRVSEDGPMVFRDWGRKRQILPMLHYLKTDAAEAEILTGVREPERAARILHEWGANEVMLTHSEGVLVYAEGRAHFAPWTARNLSGRTGRGDTCFAAYCHRRRDHDASQACAFAAALTSLKMERPGPFAGSVQEVQAAMEGQRPA